MLYYSKSYRSDGPKTCILFPLKHIKRRIYTEHVVGRCVGVSGDCSSTLAERRRFAPRRRFTGNWDTWHLLANHALREAITNERCKNWSKVNEHLLSVSAFVCLPPPLSLSLSLSLVGFLIAKCRYISRLEIAQLICILIICCSCCFTTMTMPRFLAEDNMRREC